jgi:hypothetical protein
MDWSAVFAAVIFAAFFFGILGVWLYAAVSEIRNENRDARKDPCDAKDRVGPSGGSATANCSGRDC